MSLFFHSCIVICLDGPAGSGKSTVASLLSSRLGWPHIDSGGIYRTLTLASMSKIGKGKSAEEFGEIFSSKKIKPESLDCKIIMQKTHQINYIGSRDIKSEIRIPDVTSRVRYIADNHEYRDYVNSILKSFTKNQKGLIVDGRDIGTVVFPDSSMKFFLETSPSIRSIRRRNELQEMGCETSLKEITSKIEKRDHEDRKREVGGLRKAKDVVMIDTSELTLDDVVSRIVSHLK